MASATEVLIEARRLIAEKGWCKADFAQLADGTSCRIVDPKACRFCPDGAMRRASGCGVGLEPARDFFRKSTDGSIWHWNDSKARTSEEVLSAFDRAIELSKQHPA